MTLLTMGFATALATSPARVAPIPLEDLVRFSDVIVVGEVERIEHVARDRFVDTSGADTIDHLPDDVPVASIHVSRVLKGPSEIQTVQYVAAPTWPCDVTTAVLGERALLFLGDATRDELLGEPLRREIHARLRVGDLMDLLWSGRGRMPLAEGKVTYGDVVMPNDCPFVEGAEGEGPEGGSSYSVSVDWLAERITRIQSEQRGKPWFRASVVDAGDGKLSWDLEVARDRTARQVVHARDGDHERQFTASWQTVLEVDGECRSVDGRAGARTIGAGRDRLGERRFETLGDPQDRNVRILAIDADWMSEPARFIETLQWLRAWAGIRDLVDDPECADHRASDERWLPEKHGFRRPPSRRAIWLTVIGGTLLGVVIAHGMRRFLSR